MINKFSKDENLNKFMTNKIVAIQGNHPSKLNSTSDTKEVYRHYRLKIENTKHERRTKEPFDNK